MANMRRAANRSRGKDERTYEGGRAEGGREKAAQHRKGSSGSPIHTERYGVGDVAGAGELTFGMGPGKAGGRVSPHQANLPNKDSGAGGKTPKVGSITSRGEEE